MMVLVAEPFYQHDHLGPGAPLVEITGQGEGDGYYDWAGRRLFLVDGGPDPMCPGAYRYQHNPACCDLEAPDSDPRSPRYEPMHLRHKVGDTWIIDTNRPHDPFDPGPFGTPGWYKDERTGRHRRDETPDPLPAEGWVAPQDAWFPGTADWPEPKPPQAVTRADRHGDDDRQDGSGDHCRTASDRGGADRPPPWGSRGRPVPSEPDEPSPPSRRDQARDRFWTEADHTSEHRFSKLREDAFERFMANSAQLRAAHFQPERPYLRERLAWGLRWLLWVLACGLAPMPASLNTRQPRTEAGPASPMKPGTGAAHAITIRTEALGRQAIPAQPGPASRPQPGAAQTDRPSNSDRAEHAAAPSNAKAPATPAARPGAAIAATINGARAARSVIADRGTRTSNDLAAAVRNSAKNTTPTNRANLTEAGAGHWRTQPRQSRPRPSPRPKPASYMTAWEQAFDTTTTFIRVTGGGIGAAA